MHTEAVKKIWEGVALFRTMPKLKSHLFPGEVYHGNKCREWKSVFNIFNGFFALRPNYENFLIRNKQDKKICFDI